MFRNRNKHPQKENLPPIQNTFKFKYAEQNTPIQTKRGYYYCERIINALKKNSLQFVAQLIMVIFKLINYYNASQQLILMKGICPGRIHDLC